jgi:hypothetical protein
MRRAASILGAAIPYISVAVGLYVARSAWVAILLYHFGIVVAITATGWRNRLLRARTGWRAGATVVAVATTALGGVALYVLWPLVDATPPDGGLRRALSEFGLEGASWAAFALYYATIHPFLEELFWRTGESGAVDKPGWRDAAFAGYHALVLRFFVGPVWVVVIVVVLLLASWTWRVVDRRFGGLGVPLISHAAADASIVAAATMLARGG